MEVVSCGIREHVFLAMLVNYVDSVEVTDLAVIYNWKPLHNY